MDCKIYDQRSWRFEIYDNADGLDMEEIRQKTGCIDMINLGYFALRSDPAAGVERFGHQSACMVHGEWVHDPLWPAAGGVLVDQDGRLTFGTANDAKYSYIIGCPAIKINGAMQQYTAGGRDGWSYVGGRADGSVVLLCTPDDEPHSDASLTELLLTDDYNCASLCRCDGGGSAQAYIDGRRIAAKGRERICRTWLLVYPREAPTMPLDECQYDPIRRSACWTDRRGNSRKSGMLHSTACPGVSARTLRNRWDRPESTACAHYVVDDKEAIQCLPNDHYAWHCGKSANGTHVSLEMCEPDQCRLLDIEWIPLRYGKTNPVWSVKRWQQELTRMGVYKGSVDGSFGPATQRATRDAQRALGVDPDGSVGPATLRAARSRPGSLMAYDPTETEDYFRAVWTRAVNIFAAQAIREGWDPKHIVCHCEGYKLGIASNHADVNHWIGQHGKTMDMFRYEVGRRMEQLRAPAPEANPAPSADTPDAWAKEAWKKAAAAGVLDGTRPHDPVTRQELAAVLDRLGLV